MFLFVLLETPDMFDPQELLRTRGRTRYSPRMHKTDATLSMHSSHLSLINLSPARVRVRHSVVSPTTNRDGTHLHSARVALPGSIFASQTAGAQGKHSAKSMH